MLIEVIQRLFLFIHLIGLAFLAAGLISQFPKKKRVVKKTMLYGAWVQFLSGIVMASLFWPEINLAKIGGLVVALSAIIIVLNIYKKKDFTKNAYWITVLLALIGLTIAIFWH